MLFNSFTKRFEFKLKQLAKEINLKAINHHHPIFEKVSETLWKITWDLEEIPDQIWKECFNDQLNRNGELSQRNIIRQHSYNRQDLSPKLKGQSIIFYSTSKNDNGKLNADDPAKKLIDQVITATNEEIRKWNEGTAESNKKEEESKKKDDQTKKDMLKRLSKK